MNEFGFDRAVLHAIARFHRNELDLAEFMLARLRFDERDAKASCRRPAYRKLAQQIRNAADVIFVSVRHEHRAQFVGALPHVREIADDDVDSVHLVVGEHQSAIDDDHVVVRLDDRHVAADLAATAERDDANDREPRAGWGRRAYLDSM